MLRKKKEIGLRIRDVTLITGHGSLHLNTVIIISIYTLSDLGNSSNLIG